MTGSNSESPSSSSDDGGPAVKKSGPRAEKVPPKPKEKPPKRKTRKAEEADKPKKSSKKVGLGSDSSSTTTPTSHAPESRSDDVKKKLLTEKGGEIKKQRKRKDDKSLPNEATEVLMEEQKVMLEEVLPLAGTPEGIQEPQNAASPTTKPKKDDPKKTSKTSPADDGCSKETTVRRTSPPKSAVVRPSFRKRSRSPKRSESRSPRRKERRRRSRSNSRSRRRDHRNQRSYSQERRVQQNEKEEVKLPTRSAEVKEEKPSEVVESTASSKDTVAKDGAAVVKNDAAPHSTEKTSTEEGPPAAADPGESEESQTAPPKALDTEKSNDAERGQENKTKDPVNGAARESEEEDAAPTSLEATKDVPLKRSSPPRSAVVRAPSCKRSRSPRRKERRHRSRSRSRSRSQRRDSRDRRSRRSISTERRVEERRRRHAQQEKDSRAANRAREEDPKEQERAREAEKDNETVTEPTARITDRQRRTVDLLTSRTGGAYIPPAKLRLLQSQITDKSSAAFQRIAWEALKKSIHGYINKVNVDNIAIITREMLRENIVRGRGLLCRSIIQAQAASPTFTHVYAALVSIVNSKFPNIGELLLRRLIIQFKRAFRRNDKGVCMSSARFIAHLVNQRVVHEIIALEILTLLVETPTDDSVEVAIGFLKECGMKLTEVSSRGIGAIFEMLKNILHEGKLDRRVQYMIEVVFQVRKDGFKDHPSVEVALELVEEDDQFTHLLMLDEATDPEDLLNVFKFDDKYEDNEGKYKGLCHEILGSEESESGEGSSSDSDASSGEEDEEGKAGATAEGSIVDNTDTNMVALRRTIYLTINSSLDYEECAHKLMKMQLKPGQEIELCHMFLDCCAEQRTYEKFYGLLAQRFCSINSVYVGPFEEIFADTYQTTHRLDTNRLRNVSKFFAHLLFTDAIGWDVLECVKLNEEDTTSSSRIFVKILFQELAEYMGLERLNKRLKDEVLVECLSGLFPRDNPRNTRFAINFFTSIGLGGLTDDLREFLKNAPKSVPAINAELLTRQLIAAGSNPVNPSASESASASESDSSTSTSDSSSSSSSSTSSSSTSSESDRDVRKKTKKRPKKKSEKASKGGSKKSKSKAYEKKSKRKRQKESSDNDSSDSESTDSEGSSPPEKSRKKSQQKRATKKASKTRREESKKTSKKEGHSEKRRTVAAKSTRKPRDNGEEKRSRNSDERAVEKVVRHMAEDRKDAERPRDRRAPPREEERGGERERNRERPWREREDHHRERYDEGLRRREDRERNPRRERERRTPERNLYEQRG